MTALFNYSTGPVQVAASTLAAATTAPSTSHSGPGQVMVAETITALRDVLQVPADFDLFLVPGSIRQTIDALISALVPADAGLSVTSVEDGYWGRLMGEMLRSTRNNSRTISSFDHSEDVATDVITAVHMETETGRILPLDVVRAAHDRGALSIVDIACTAPIHQLDYSLCDVAILGSHKCLGSIPGLSIVISRSSRVAFGDWTLGSYLADGRAKTAWSTDPTQSAGGPPPLPTYPLEVVAALHATVDSLRADRANLHTRSARAATTIREAAERLGFTVHSAPGKLSACVTRLDAPMDIAADEIQDLLTSEGFFVIGNVGASTGSSIRIGTMSSAQCHPDNVAALIDALARACAAARALASAR